MGGGGGREGRKGETNSFNARARTRTHTPKDLSATYRDVSQDHTEFQTVRLRDICFLLELEARRGGGRLPIGRFDTGARRWHGARFLPLNFEPLRKQEVGRLFYLVVRTKPMGRRQLWVASTGREDMGIRMEIDVVRNAEDLTNSSFLFPSLRYVTFRIFCCSTRVLHEVSI